MADIFERTEALTLGGGKDNVPDYERYAAVAILRVGDCAAHNPAQLRPSSWVHDHISNKLLSVQLTGPNFRVVATYGGPRRGGLLVALLDYNVVVDLNANRYDVPLQGEDIDYEVEGTTRPVFVWHESIQAVRRIVDALALQAALK